MFIPPGYAPDPPPRPQPQLGPSEAPRAARLRPVILLCGKCLKRCDDGKALRRALKDGAKAHSAEASGGGKTRKARKVRLVRTGCLGLCPKSALVAASAATLASGEALLLRDEAEARAALGRLLP